MVDSQWLHVQANKTLARLWPRIEARFATQAAADPQAWQDFTRRVNRHFERLFSRLYILYGNQYDFFYHLEHLLQRLGLSWFARPAELKLLDAAREADPA